MKRARIREEILSCLSEVIGQSARELDPGTAFSCLGIDSLMLLRLSEKLSRAFGRSINTNFLFNHPSVEQLAEALDGLIHPVVVTRPREQAGAEPKNIASIVGMACRFPGAPDLKSFWELLREGRSGLSERVLAGGQRPRKGGYISGYKTFDAKHFGIPKNEAAFMDPQQRWLMTECWHALEDAGFDPRELGGRNVGVYVGVSSMDYALLNYPAEDVHVNQATGNAHSIAANRLSYYYDFKGPSLAIDTACSSSLTALHLASEALKYGEIEIAIVAGVNALFVDSVSRSFEDAGMLSPDDSCKTFSDDANGYVRGEGVGVLVLQSHGDAVAQGRRVYAKILGSSLTSDGKTNGLTAPNGLAQKQAIEQALASAKLAAADVQYIEAHGTGTRLGDPIEYQSLHEIFGNSGVRTYLGSVKTNIGHLEAAAGIAGVIKSALSIFNRHIPAHLGFTRLNRLIADIESELTINTESIPWDSETRICGVSSFGFGGSNSHVLLSSSAEQPAESGRFLPVVQFSVNDKARVPEICQKWAAFLKDEGKRLGRLAPIGGGLKYRYVAFGKDLGQLIRHLETLDSRFVIDTSDLREKQVVVRFGNNSLESASFFRHLYENEPGFAGAFDLITSRLSYYLRIDLTALLFQNRPPEELEQLEHEAFDLAVAFSAASVLAGYSDCLKFNLPHSRRFKTHQKARELIDQLATDSAEGGDLTISFEEHPDPSLNWYRITSLAQSLSAARGNAKGRSWGLPLSIFNEEPFWREAAVPRDTQKNGSAPPPYAVGQVVELLTELVSDATDIPQEKVDVSGNLMDLGIDSLTVLNALQMIRDQFRVEIPMSLVFSELQSISKLSDYIVRSRPQAAGWKAAAGDKAIDLSPSPEQKGVLGNFKVSADRSPEARVDGTYIADLMRRFGERTRKSKAYAQRHRRHFADNRMSAGFRPGIKEAVYPIVFRAADGATLTDIDGNSYVDFSMGFGVHLFGHRPRFLTEAIQKRLELGSSLGPQSELTGPVADLFCELTGHERVAFCNSGTEAVMTAIRLARAGSGKKRLVLFNGSYHGHFDGVLSRMGQEGHGIPLAPGVTPGFTEDVVVLDYCEDPSLQFIAENQDSIGAVLVEPVQSRFPELQPKEFLAKLRRITEKHGIALIFDEVITGFRVHRKGAAGVFGIEPDLSVFGKIVGGGLPIGIVAGKRNYLDFIDGGYWAFGDTSFPAHEMTFFAGTFSKHPLAMASMHEVLKKLSAEGEQIYAALEDKTRAMCDELNSFFRRQSIEIQAVRFGSLFRFKANLNLDFFFLELVHRGFYLWEGRSLFLSTAHSEQDIEAFVKAVKRVASTLFRSKSLPAETYPLTALQERFVRLLEGGQEEKLATQIHVAVKMKGDVSLDSLRDAIAVCTERADIFHTRFDTRRKCQFRVPVEACALRVEDLSGEKRVWKVLDQRLADLAKTPLNPLSDSPLQFHLFQINPETSVLAIVCSHIAVDGWTLTQLVQDLSKVYGALVNGAQVPPLRPSFSHEQYAREITLSPSELERSLQYWKSRFEGAPKPQEPPQGRFKSGSHVGDRFVFALENDVYLRVKRISKELKITPFLYLLSTFAQTMVELDMMSSPALGVPVSSREKPGHDRTMGHCSNILPFRVSRRSSFREYVEHFRSEFLSNLTCSSLSYEEIERSLGRQLFNITFNLEPSDELPDFGDVTLFLYPYPVAASEFPLTANVTDLDYYYHCEFDFQLGFKNRKEIEAISQKWVSVLKASFESITSLSNPVDVLQ